MDIIEPLESISTVVYLGNSGITFKLTLGTFLSGILILLNCHSTDPVTDPGQAPRQVVQPEDKLKAGMKEQIVASVVGAHERCEDEVDKRYRFEEKIKRTYYHVKPLDLKQLKNWNAYLDFEISEGDHERIVVLFERCLIPCANYEQLWWKYAKYLENYHRRV